MEKTHKLYLVKGLAPWMMEELICFSKFTRFKILFFRKVNEFYQSDLDVLKNNGIELVFKPFNKRIGIGDLFFSIKFLLANLNKLFDRTNHFWTMEAVTWFIRLNKKELEGVKSIHAQFSTQSAILAKMLYKKFGVEYSFTFHAHDIYTRNKWFNQLTANSMAAISISKYNMDYVVQKYQVNREKLKLSRLGVRLPQQNYKKESSEKIILGFMSHLEEKKGIPYLMEAFKDITHKYPEKFELWIAGDGDEMNFIKHFTEENKIHESVKILGRIRDQQKIDFYTHIDIFVLPSIKIPNDMDGIPVVLMEAIAFGKPIISTDVSGIPEICINDYDGILIKEKNTVELKTAIEKLAFNEELRKELSNNSIHLANSDYDLVKNSETKLKQINWL